MNNMNNIDIENMNFDKLEKEIETFKKDIETKYKDYLDDQK